MGINTRSVLPAFPVRALARIVLLSAGTFLLAGIIAPWIPASHWNAPVRRHLESLLGRHIEFSELHFTLLSGPGFSLNDVLIGEDPRYGLEPFAYVPTLRVRLRLDRLFLGEFRVANLRLDDPSLNLVRRGDGSWNVLELVERVGAPRRTPLSFFPVLEVSGGRIDFKLGARKTTLYISDTDVTIYPQRLGKLFLQFSGSPARTDRAGNGFGHVRGRVNWFVASAGSPGRIQADLNLDPSNLSEMTTLFEGHDIGLHGTVRTHLVAHGTPDHLQLQGATQFDDFYRWDLLPMASGSQWTVRYTGTADLDAHRFTLETVESSKAPLALTINLSDFLRTPEWSVTARLRNVPVQNLLPFSRRMGLDLPAHLTMSGSADGTITVTSASGIEGTAQLTDVKAVLPDLPPLRAQTVNVALRDDRLHFEPTAISSDSGIFQASGDIFLMSPKANVSLTLRNYPFSDLRSTLSSWVSVPPASGLLQDGTISGQVLYRQDATAEPSWSGRLQFAGATLRLPGLARPLHQFEGRVTFNGPEIELSRFSALLGERQLRGSYRYNPDARHPERLHLEVSALEVSELQSLLAPTLEAHDWLARLRVTRRSIPAWIAQRDVDADVIVHQVLAQDISAGPLTCRFTWRGAAIDVTSVNIQLSPSASVQAKGSLDLASYFPSYNFNAVVRGFLWHGGVLDASADLQTSGTGSELLRRLQASGTFTGYDLALSSDTSLKQVTGAFQFSLANGWPDLRLSQIQADEAENSWTGSGTTQSDGRLILDLERAGQQRRIVSSLEPLTASPAATIER